MRDEYCGSGSWQRGVILSLSKYEPACGYFHSPLTIASLIP